MIQKSTEAIELAKLKTKPMFKLELMTVETGDVSMPEALDSGKNPISMGVGISIPWSSSKNQSRIQESELKRLAAVENKRLIEDLTAANLKRVYFRLENARRLVDLYEKSLIPQAEQAMEVAETWHQESTKSITEFLETQSVWLNFNLARLRAITDYRQNLARLERLIGGKRFTMKSVGQMRHHVSRFMFHIFHLTCSLLLSILLLACANGRQTIYQEQLTQFQEAPTPQYYRTEVAKEVTASKIDKQVDKDAFLTEVEAKVLKFQKEFQAQLENEMPIPEPFYDFSIPKIYLELATKVDQAEARLAETVNLDLLLAFGYAWNPGIKAARKKLKATLEQYPQAAYLDNVLQQYNAFTKQLDTKIGPPRHKEMMAMKFPFPDMLALKGQIVTEDVQIAQKGNRHCTTRSGNGYQISLLRLPLPQNQSIEINRENQQVLRQMIHIAQAKFRTGIGKYHSVIMAQVELSKLSHSIITLEEQRGNYHCPHQHTIKSPCRCLAWEDHSHWSLKRLDNL